MTPLAVLRNLHLKTTVASPPSQFLLISVPLTMVVLAILVVAFQINRQLYDQQQVIVGRLSHAAVRHIAQLQREHLRLQAMIEATTDTVDEEAFQLQRNLVESRVNIMWNTVLTSDQPQEVYDLYKNYAAGWQTLQPELDAWQMNPKDITRKTLIVAQMKEIELHVNSIANLVQLSFEDRIGNWANKSRFLNRLLTLGSASFAVIILLMAYTSYLFFRQQSANEQRLRMILDAIPDAVYRVNRSGFFTDYKPATNDSHSLTSDALKGKSIRDTLPPPAAELVQEGIQTVLAGRKQLLLELALPDPRSTEIHHYEARLLPSGSDEVQIIARDVTQLKAQEESALQAQKLESLGVLAGGIAHDFNNLLAGMLGQASLAAAKLERNLSVSDNIQKIIFSAERAAELTRQLLAYTGKGKFQIAPVQINKLILDTTGLMETALPSGTHLDLALEDDLPPVQADQSQIQQVIMNLFINAIEALPDGKGTVALSTCVQQMDGEPSASIAAKGTLATSDILEPGQYVVIRVADNGIGMDQATLSRIFDPFFSTKPKGHGLGLSATTGIIRTHHGALQVQSQLGHGTTFTILLPVYSEHQASDEEKREAAPVATADHSTPQTANAARTVLMIDDETQVREVAAEILTQHGFQVTAAASGCEGVDLFRKEKNRIGVVLLDLKMPGMDGKETYQELQKIQPDLKVIFTSGYSESAVSDLVSGSAHTTFLPKPYTAQVLKNEVHRMLLL